MQAIFDEFMNGFPNIQTDVMTIISALLVAMLIILGTHYVIVTLLSTMNVDKDGGVSFKKSEEKD